MKVVKTICSIVLAVLVLMSSTSFMVGMHFCMGEVQDVALFSKADACENEQNVPPCHRHLNPCCDDETLIHEGDDFQVKNAGVPLSATSATDVEPPVVIIAEIIPSTPAMCDEHRIYDPPLRSRNLTLEHSVLLI